MKIIIVGAGAVGSIVAQKLSAENHDVTLIEAQEVVGGMAGSFEIAGQRVDFGSHRLHPATDPARLRREAELLERYRRGQEPAVACPLQRALAHDAGPLI